MQKLLKQKALKNTYQQIYYNHMLKQKMEQPNNDLFEVITIGLLLVGVIIIALNLLPTIN